MTTLTKLELYQEDGLYFLRAEYEIGAKHRLEKYTIPKIYLPISQYPIVVHQCGEYTKNYPARHTIDLGFGELELCKDKNDNFYTMEVLQEYPQKMTLEEIEKKLGYKVELVSGK